jgi:hypothetical protein
LDGQERGWINPQGRGDKRRCQINAAKAELIIIGHRSRITVNNFPGEKGKGLPQFLQTGFPLGGEAVVFADPAFENLQTAVKEVGFFHGMEQGVKAAGTDVITPVPERLFEPDPVNRPLPGLVQDEQLHHSLPKRLVELGFVFHRSDADIYRLGKIADLVNFSLILTFPNHFFPNHFHASLEENNHGSVG